MNELTQLMPLLRKRSLLYIESSVIICRKFCFVLFMLLVLMANQAALEKNHATIENIVFSFSVNCSFNNAFSFEIIIWWISQGNHGEAVTHLFSWNFKTYTVDLMLAGVFSSKNYLVWKFFCFFLALFNTSDIIFIL